MRKQGDSTPAIATTPHRATTGHKGTSLKGLIFDLQSFAVHDGPGCRTLIFFKGCPLRCKWCCNPEGIEPYPEVMYSAVRCQRCHKCVQACPFNAIAVNEDQSVSIDRRVCRDQQCYKRPLMPCIQACHNEGLSLVGKYVTIDELMGRLERERKFWGPEGGVTLSGGEPMYQPQFAIALLERCQQEYIHTAMETCGQMPWEYYELALDCLDWLFYDLKCMDPVKHKEETGIANELILDNMDKIAAKWRRSGKPRVVVRVPLIPGHNDSEENIRATAKFVSKLQLEEVNILPFHRLGASKYERLDLEYKYRDLSPPGSLDKAQELFHSYGLKAYVGSLTPF